MVRKRYDKQFKIAAVKLVSKNEAPCCSGSHGIIHKHWIREYEEYGESAFPLSGNALSRWLVNGHKRHSYYKRFYSSYTFDIPAQLL